MLSLLYLTISSGQIIAALMIATVVAIGILLCKR
jgi:hypothetical protein